MSRICNLWEFVVEGLRPCCYFSKLHVNIISVSCYRKKTQFCIFDSYLLLFLYYTCVILILRRCCMDLDLCYYLRSRGDGLESLLRTIVDHVVKMRLYDWRREGTQNCVVFTKTCCNRTQGFVTLLLQHLAYLYVNGDYGGHRTLHGIAKYAKT